MRIFQHWVRHQTQLQINGELVDVRCFGGSNRSPEDAIVDAEHRMAAVRARVLGQLPDTQEYETDIREEPLCWLDERNAVTRNRYGAEVLNSADHMFFDVDAPRYSFWETLFGLPRGAKLKRRILDFIARQAAHRDLQGRSLRLYETHKGIRVLVGGTPLPADSDLVQKMMERLSCDWLYAAMCRRQRCFRARLTPKPYRMKVRGLRVVYPREPDQESVFREWLTRYDERRADYACCRYLYTLGSEWDSPVIRYHDERCGAHSDLPLA